MPTPCVPAHIYCPQNISTLFTACQPRYTMCLQSGLARHTGYRIHVSTTSYTTSCHQSEDYVSALSVRIFPYPTGQSEMTKCLLERPSRSRPRYIYVHTCQTGQLINIKCVSDRSADKYQV